ncbi:MAG: Dabb family protein [bacterium]|nr:Dabb family protein [bacterium]
MIRHVVLLKLHEHADGADKLTNARRVKELLEIMPGKVEGLLRLEVGINELPGPQAYDVIINCDFPNWATLEYYRDHPLHRDVMALLNRVRSDRAVVDWEIK